MPMTREQAIDLVRQYVKNKNLLKHMIATGACMASLAKRLGGDPHKWELAGILHDIDLDETADDFSRHGLVSVERLKQHGITDQEMLDAVLAHADKKPRQTLIEKAIYAADPTTGFIVACALMHPTKSLAGLDLRFLKKRFKEKRFAAGASREQMASCADFGMELDEFLQLCLDAMRSVSDEIGL